MCWSTCVLFNCGKQLSALGYLLYTFHNPVYRIESQYNNWIEIETGPNRRVNLWDNFLSHAAHFTDVP